MVWVVAGFNDESKQDGKPDGPVHATLRRDGTQKFCQDCGYQFGFKWTMNSTHMQTPPLDIPRDNLPIQSRRSRVHVLKQLFILLLSPRSGLLNGSEEGVPVVRLLGFGR